MRLRRRAPSTRREAGIWSLAAALAAIGMIARCLNDRAEAAARDAARRTADATATAAGKIGRL